MSKEANRRKLLAVLNSCNMKKCKYYKRDTCTHFLDAVDSRTGEDICPLKNCSVDRKYFKG